MKSFYQFYNEMKRFYQQSSTHDINLYLVLFGNQGQNTPIKIERVYEDRLDAIRVSKALGVSWFSIRVGGEKLPANGTSIYLFMDKWIDGTYSIDSHATFSRRAAKSFKSGFPLMTIRRTTFVTKRNAFSTPKPPPVPTNSYANLKYPLIGELTHYLSTQNLNQEIYHVMRDKSQKSINLLNQLKTLINKIELA